jgi:hypothetical protein
MKHCDGTMTTVEQPSSTSQLDSLKVNGHVQSGIGGQPCLKNVDSKVGIIQSTLEKSTFGVISPSALNGADGTSTSKPDRVKIIVKRKSLTEEAVKDGRTSSPNKKCKVSSPSSEVDGVQELRQVKTRNSAASLAQHVSGLGAERQCKRERVVGGENVCGTVPSLNPVQPSGPGSRNGDLAVSIPPESSSDSLRDVLSSAVGDGITSSPSGGSAAVSRKLRSRVRSSTPLHLPELDQTISDKELTDSHHGSDSDSKDVPPTQVDQNSRVRKEEHLRRESSINDGAQRVGSAFESVSSTDKTGTSSLEKPHTPKAKRTPLFFTRESANESSLQSSPSGSTTPPMTSSPAPAKRTPLRLRSGGPSLVATSNADRSDDGAVDQRVQVRSVEGAYNPCDFCIFKVPLSTVIITEIVILSVLQFF